MPRFELNFLADYGDEALLEELRRIAALVPEEEPLTAKSYGAHSPKVAADTIRRRFGGWKEALGRAGLLNRYHGQPVSEKMRIQPAKLMSNNDVISELRRVHAIVGKEWLSGTDFNAHSVTSVDTVRARFGTFRKGLDAAGIRSAPGKVSPFTEQQCFENIADLWAHYGRTPAYRELFSPPSTVQGKPYVTKWGTWRSALKAFVDWANGEEQASSPTEQKTVSDNTQDPPIAERTEADCREIRPGLRFRVFMRDRFRCVACGRSPATHLDIELHADHILAVANGGKTTMENLQTLCRDCSLGKGRAIIN
jgi:hypothetical protein